MKGKWKLFLIAVAIVLIAGSLTPIFPDPYHESDSKVNFWVWLWREIDELLHGEK